MRYSRFICEGGISMKENRQKVIRLFDNPRPRQKVEVVKLQLVREGKALYGTAPFHHPGEAAEMMEPLFQNADREILAVLSLDTAMTPIAAEIVAVGGVTGCSVDAKDLFKHAILSNATQILIFHNHPSGTLEPSRDDIAVTVRIKEAGDILGIRLLDHIILGLEGMYFSFKERGVRPFEHKEDAA